MPSACSEVDQGALESLRTFLAFSNLDSKARRGCDRGATLYRKNAVIFQEGHTPFGFFGVCGGLLKLCKAGPRGKLHTVALVPAGGLVGFPSLLAEEPYSVTAVAMTPSRILFFSRHAFLQAREEEEILMHFAVRLSREIGREREARLSSVDQPAQTRLARCLLGLQDTFSIERSGLKLDSIRIPRGEIADMISVCPETVSRLLASLKAQGILKFRGTRIVLQDSARLRAIAYLGESPASCRLSDAIALSVSL